MSLADELRKLQELHARGGLTDEEFSRAKAALLASAPPSQGPPGQAPTSSAVDPEEALTPQRLRVMQIVAGALLAGVVVFLAVALVIVLGQNKGQGIAPPRGLPMVSLMAVVWAAVLAPLAFVVPRIQTHAALRRIRAGTWQAPAGVNPAALATDWARLLAVRQTTLLLGLALLEGAAFMGCMAFLLEGQPLGLAVVAVAVVLMAFKFPTGGRVRAWLERQADVLGEMHQGEGVSGER